MKLSSLAAAALSLVSLAPLAACQDDNVRPGPVPGTIRLPNGRPDAIVVSQVDWPQSRPVPLPVTSGSFGLDRNAGRDGHLLQLDVLQAGARLGYLLVDGRHLVRPVHLSLLSEYASRRMDDFLELVPTARIELFQDRIAQSLVREDLDGDGLVDYRDILAFDPDDATQVAKLAFDYGEVLDRKLACNCTLRDTYASPIDPRELEARLAEVFDPIVDVDFPNAESPPAFRSVLVDVDTGGSATIDELPGITLDSDNRQYFYRDAEGAEPATLTIRAKASDAYHFVRWVGCDAPNGDTCVMHTSTDAPSVSAQFGLDEKMRDGVDLLRLDDLAPDALVKRTDDDLEITVASGGPADLALGKVGPDRLIASSQPGVALSRITAVGAPRTDAGDNRARYSFTAKQVPPTDAYEQISGFEPDRVSSIEDVESVTISDDPVPDADPVPPGGQGIRAKRTIKDPVWLVGYGRAFELGHGLFLTRLPGKEGMSVVRAEGTPEEMPLPTRGGETKVCALIGFGSCVLPLVTIQGVYKKIFKVKLAIEAGVEVKTSASVAFARPAYINYETRGRVRFTVGAELSVGFAAKAEAFQSCRSGSTSAPLPKYESVPDTLDDARVEENIGAFLADNTAAETAAKACTRTAKTSLDPKPGAKSEKLDVKEVTVQLNKGTPAGVAFPVSVGFKIGIEARGNVGLKVKYIFDVSHTWDAGFELGKKCSGLVFGCDDFKSSGGGRSRTSTGHKLSVSVGANGVLAPYASLGIYAGVNGVKEDLLKLEGTISTPLRLVGFAGGITYSSLPEDRAAGTNGWCTQDKAGLIVGMDLVTSFGLVLDARFKKSILGWDIEFGGEYDIFKVSSTIPIMNDTTIVSTKLPIGGACRSIDNAPIATLPDSLEIRPGELDWSDPATRRLTKTHELRLQDDGNFVLSRLTRDNNGTITSRDAIWATNTAGYFGSRVVFQKDGNLVVYDLRERPIWSSDTSNRGAGLLKLQADGNLVIYNGSSAVWASNTNGR